MRVYYEKLINPIEQTYENKSTVENVLFLEDIVKDVSKDIYVQYKSVDSNTINYEYGNLEIEGVVKIKNHIYFMNWHKGTYYNYGTFDNLKENTIKVMVANSNLTNGDYAINVYVNDVLVEEHPFTDLYSLYNRKFITIDSVILGTQLTITQPLKLNTGEFVTYKVYTINITSEPAMHRFLATFDSINNAIIFDRKYFDSEISIILQTCGSILRSSTINDLYRLNAGSFVQYDEATNMITIPNEQVYKTGNTIKYIKTQDVLLDPQFMDAGYNLIGVYLDTSDQLAYDIVTSDPSYSTLISKTNNYQLDLVKQERSYVGFIMGLNNISKFIPTDVWLYNVGTGDGGGGGSAKIVQDFTNLEELNIDFVAATQVPMIQVYDETGDIVEPENVHYNLNNKITITFGTQLTGQVAII